jgi:hypothetical protein
MRSWIGKSVFFIGVVHSVFGFVVFRSTLGELVGEGLINTVNGQPDREFVFWFLFFGFMAIIAGLLIDWCEKTVGVLPGFLGWSLLALTLVCVTIMPVSGAWLLLVPAVGAVVRSVKPTHTSLKT